MKTARMRGSAAVAMAAVLLCGACGPLNTQRRKKTMTASETKHTRSKFTGPKRRIGVVDFENKSTYGKARLGSSATDVLITELTKTGKFVVVERDKLNKLLDEQRLQASGAIDPRTAVKVGKILGLNAMVTGAVSQFGVSTGGSEYIIVQSKSQKAECTVDIRVVDVETGRVLYADSGTGMAKSSKGSLLGLGTRGGYDETIEGKAIRAAIVQFTDNIVSQISQQPWSCRIAAVRGDKVYLNAGPTMGVNKGLKMECFHLGREIRDPTTGLSLGNEEEPLGQIEVMGPLGDTGEGSIARVVTSLGPRPRAKDICRLSSE